MVKVSNNCCLWFYLQWQQRRHIRTGIITNDYCYWQRIWNDFDDYVLQTCWCLKWSCHLRRHQHIPASNWPESATDSTIDAIEASGNREKDWTSTTNISTWLILFYEYNRMMCIPKLDFFLSTVSSGRLSRHFICIGDHYCVAGMQFLAK